MVHAINDAYEMPYKVSCANSCGYSKLTSSCHEWVAFFILARGLCKVLRNQHSNNFITSVDKVREAAEMRCYSHMRLSMRFYNQSCSQLYRRDAIWEPPSDLGLCVPYFVLLFSNGLEGSQTVRTTFDVMVFCCGSASVGTIKGGWSVLDTLYFIHDSLTSDSDFLLQDSLTVDIDFRLL